MLLHTFEEELGSFTFRSPRTWLRHEEKCSYLGLKVYIKWQKRKNCRQSKGGRSHQNILQTWMKFSKIYQIGLQCSHRYSIIYDSFVPINPSKLKTIPCEKCIFYNPIHWLTEHSNIVYCSWLVVYHCDLRADFHLQFSHCLALQRSRNKAAMWPGLRFGSLSWKRSKGYNGWNKS